MWFQVFPPALCYFLFHWQFFCCVESSLKVCPLKWRRILTAFFLNYGLFIFCTLFNFHLITNWVVFLFLLLGEQAVFYRQPIRKCALFALLGAQLGLAVNILFRSLIAIILNVPLITFDNTPGNLKIYPVILGFLAAGLLFYCITRFHLLKNLDAALNDQKTLAFLLGLLAAMFFYLCMNLMIYYIEENDVILKLWSMKSAVFVIVGEWLSLILSIRLGQITVYRKKSQEAAEQLVKERLRELKLQAIASVDPLTGCQNRLQARPRLQEALDIGRVFSLGFVDLNRLKSVNDSFGHEMGDLYIQTAARVLNGLCREGDFLFRYGGDEFLLLLFDTTEADAKKSFQEAQIQLEKEQKREGCPFSMGISFGVAGPGDGTDALEVIQAADARMYQMKRSGQ